ncbi:unnamed protein product (macronuclear) [Paramecium tetraurelia]|uniref:HTH merR-type domain-containing protein n=1 Tax=Paramecium tetraurelia TaxID=5888 RepID=A0C8C8_PARTE|nr:uncharacterized protein GSPATT00036178001 [Paramecium tetraurelia]CAK67045.1 unnamed protein product [Paramecium tetraurelia]|eukprot:XP_001434442.1 hypothetical protein (macronuclear) [Paramecium tetraurelia strain d4-2]
MYTTDFQDIDSKRVKERLVESAFNKVQIWRKIFLEGLINEQGERQYYTLNEAANLVGIPKKTLEDYTQIFQKVGLIASPLSDFYGKKMGFLRQFVRKNKSKIRKALIVERLKQYERKREKLIQKHQAQRQHFGEENASSKDTESIDEKYSYNNFFNSDFEELDVYQESRVFLPLLKF